MIEYLSDLNEKWMVRKVSICSFGPVWSRFGKSSFSFSFRKYSDPGNFVKIQEIFENSENGVRETLFSEDFIWSNICRIYMKSWQWERSNSVLFDLFYSLFVGPFAPDQWAKLIRSNYSGACDGITTGWKTFRSGPKILTSHPIRSTNRTPPPYLGHEIWISCQNRGDLCRKVKGIMGNLLIGRKNSNV